MRKYFQQWSHLKTYIHNYEIRRFFHEREVWWCSTGVNIGNELDGKGIDFSRPVLILREFNKDSFICLPITTKIKNDRYHSAIDFGDGIKRMCVLSQIRYMDSKRLLLKICTIDLEQFQIIRQKAIGIIQRLFVDLPSGLPEGEAEASLLDA